MSEDRNKYTPGEKRDLSKIVAGWPGAAQVVTAFIREHRCFCLVALSIVFLPEALEIVWTL